ncbi:hypothetical protein EV132_112165 [Rhizobium sullae]|uniref:LysR family transcriptional regulator n=1 Tax=Rhizobium sullae TaxID=50338 RepID=A0A4R3PZV3_RHISU|nr:hypothetical protein EV132_112165 [Rhizobium sullae]
MIEQELGLACHLQEITRGSASKRVWTRSGAYRLKIVLADYEREPVPIHIVHSEGHMVSTRVRAFVDFAAERLRHRAGVNAELPESDEVVGTRAAPVRGRLVAQTAALAR